MGVNRVGCPLDPVEVESQTDGLCSLGDSAIDLIGIFLSAKLLVEIGLSLHAAEGHVGIQLKRMPVYLERMVRAQLKRILEARLANVAPRANWVAQDIELDLHLPSMSALGDMCKRVPLGWRRSSLACRTG